MHLQSGSRLGRYEVIEPLGRGGMGQVYRARDPGLQRDVALKIIHPELVDDDHRGRFRREARVLAALSHPNVAAVHELAEIDGTFCLVMELVPGDTLADRLAVAPLPLNDALRIAAQIAAAIEAIHDSGIVHRDLKPSNVKITADGLVKVLDFGLAKRLPAAVDVSAVTTASVDMSRPGLVAGTAAYMSPEQARGGEVDRRSDVWSFGCVLYEMLCGRTLFGATTVADTIAAVLEREPDLGALPPGVPPEVRRLLRRCLERDLKRRLRDIGDARLELEDTLSAPLASDRSRVLPAAGRFPMTAAVGLLAAGVLLGGLAAWSLTRSPAQERRPVQFFVPLPPGTELGGRDFPSIAVAPDGSRLAYVGSRGGQTLLFVRELDALDSQPLAGTTNAVAPFFSPDGRWIAFFADGQLKKIAASGGAAVTLCDAPVGLGGSWGPDETIVFAPTTGSAIWRVEAAGGQLRRLTTLDEARGEFSHRWPQWLPGGTAIVYAAGRLGSWNDAEIVVETLETGERAVVVQGGTSPRYLPSGHLLYAHDGRIVAVPFDARRLAVTGPPVPALESIEQSADGASQLAVSDVGHVVFVAAGRELGRPRLVSVGRDGATQPFAAPPGEYSTPRLSPDGRRVLVLAGTANPDVWVYEVESGTSTQVTFDAGASAPIWTPDGQRLVFGSARSGAPNLFLSAMTSPAAFERLAASTNLQIAGSWSPDGTRLAYVERRPATGRDILLLTPSGARVPQSFLASRAEESAPRFSPDGAWLAYVSNETGRNEVYVRRAMPGDERVLRISDGGGSEPVWDRRGGELFYREGDRVMAAAVTAAGGDMRVAPPRMLFEQPFARGTMDWPNYDVGPDGRFVMLQGPPRDDAPATLQVMLDWRVTPAAASLR